MLSATFEHMDPPGYLEGVPSCLIWGCGVSEDVVVCSSFSCFTDYGVVDRAVGAGCVVVTSFYYLAEACMKVCKFAFIAVVVSMGDLYQWTRSKAVYRGVCRGEYDIRECVPVHHSTCAGVRLVIVGSSGVGFNFPNVGQ